MSLEMPEFQATTIVDQVIVALVAARKPARHFPAIDLTETIASPCIKTD